MLDDKSDLPVFAMMTTNEQSHDLGLLGDHSGVLGRIHHLAYWLDQRLDVERAADMLMEDQLSTVPDGMEWAFRPTSISVNPVVCASS